MDRQASVGLVVWLEIDRQALEDIGDRVSSDRRRSREQRRCGWRIVRERKSGRRKGGKCVLSDEEKVYGMPMYQTIVS